MSCLLPLMAAAVGAPLGPGHPKLPESQLADVDRTFVLRIGSLEVSAYALAKNIAARPNPGAAESDVAAFHDWFRQYLARQVVIAEGLARGYDTRPKVVDVVNRVARHMLSTPIGPFYESLVVGQTGNGRELRASALLPAAEKLRSERMTVLAIAHALALDRESVRTLHVQLRKLPADTLEIPEECCRAIGRVPLASYSDAGHPATLSVAAWREYFNGLFVRRLPRTEEEIADSVQNMWLAELDCREARRSGIDRGSRFVEDRRNFTYYQALELFEQDALRRMVSLAPAELVEEYERNPAAYMRPIRAWGRLFRFDSPEQAAQLLASGLHTTEGTGGVECEISVARPVQGLEEETRLMLLLPDGGALGPVTNARGTWIFLKDRTELAFAAFDTVSSEIEATLVRRKLDQQELRWAREWAPHFKIEDRIPYESFGVDRGSVVPWK